MKCFYGMGLMYGSLKACTFEHVIIVICSIESGHLCECPTLGCFHFSFLFKNEICDLLLFSVNL